MSSTLRSTQSDSAQWAGGEPTARTTVRPRGSRIEWQPRARAPVPGRGLALFPIAFCAGVVATLAWQSYEAVPAVPSPDQEVLKAISLDLTGVRQHLDEIATQLTVDHEQMTLVRQHLDEIATQFTVDHEQMTRDLTGVRQLDEIATQLTLDHEQMTRDITRRLEAAEKNILDKIGSALPPRPTAAPVRSAH